jgi:hypothetical protein
VRGAFVLPITVFGLLAQGGCGTVDTGPETGPPTGCDVPPAFFVSDVWPNYFAAYGCGKSDCHDASAGHGFFRLQSVAGVPTPNPTDPVSSWPTAWAANLLAVERNVSCNNPTSSLVLVVPEGRGEPHPPGVIVTDPASADALFSQWLK